MLNGIECIDVDYACQLHEARRGNRVAIGWLLSREQSWLSAHAKRATSSGTSIWTARDLVQECCLAVLRAPNPPNSRTRAQFRSWLKTILRNQVLNELRRRRPSLLEEEKDPTVAQRERAESVRFLIEWMSSSRRELFFSFEAILVLRDFCGCSFETVTQLLECPTKKATYRLRSRAMDAVKGNCSCTA